MLTEDYVSFETAKLLKEKGFDKNTEHEIWYVIKQFSPGCQWNCCTYKVGDTTREYDNKCCIPKPTLQMAMKWLREVHNLHIVVFYYDNSAFPYIWYIFAHNGDKPHKANSYEEACEAAIKYCLENLV